MQIQYLGHSSFLITIGNYTILTDPFISGNPINSTVKVEDITCDFILISHGHADHILDAAAIAKRTNATIICSWEIYEWFQKKGLTNLHPMNTGGGWQFAFGKVKCVVAQHSSGLPDGSYGGNPMGFVIESTEGNFYFAGDTALTLDMQLIPRICKPLDYAILPIGSNFTMDVADAIIAAEFIACKKIIGCHFDTFGFIVIDKEQAIADFTAADIDLVLLEIGGVSQIS